MKLSQCSLMGLATVALAMGACTTEDPRGSLNDPFFEANNANPPGLAELCDDDTPCATGLTCYRDDPDALFGACTPDAIAAACSASTSCGNGLCNVEAFVETPASADDYFAYCVCPTGEEWNGATCVMAGPAAPASEIGALTCPAVFPVPDVQDPTTSDCPEGTFCAVDGSEGCLRPQVTFAGLIDGATIAVDLQDIGDNVACVREYVMGGEGASDGFQLVLTGTAAAAVLADATDFVIDVSGNDAIGSGSFRVWPQMSAPDLPGDAIFGTVTATTATGTTAVAAIGGDVTVSESSGPDEDDDMLIDDGTGFLGGNFYFGFGGDDFLTGSFVVRNCSTEMVPDDS